MAVEKNRNLYRGNEWWVKEAEKAVGKLWNKNRKCLYGLLLPYLPIAFSSMNHHIDTVPQLINHSPADGIKTLLRSRFIGISGSVWRHRDDVRSYIFTRPLESTRTATSNEIRNVKLNVGLYKRDHESQPCSLDSV